MFLRRALTITIAVLSLAAASAAPTVVPGLHRYALDNGLELFVYERHDAPVASLGLAFRAGTMIQTAETAGASHLLEHLFVAGVDPADPLAAYARVGAASSGGETTEDAVIVSMTVGAGKVGAAFDLWAKAALAPVDDARLAIERKALQNEAALALADVDYAYEAAVTRKLLRNHPWRADPYGDPATLDRLDQAVLGALKSKYFVPNNAMLYVGGDVDPEAVFAEAKRAFAEWKAAADPWKTPLPRQALPGVTRPMWAVFPDATVPAGTGSVELRYRGPDAAAEPASARAASALAELAKLPGNRLAASVAKAVPGAAGAEAFGADYFMRRDGAMTSFSLGFSIPANTTLAEIAQRYFKEQVRGAELYAFTRNATYFTAAEIAAVNARFQAARDFELADPAVCGEALARYWAAAQADYWLTFPADAAKLTAADLQAYARRFFMQNLELTVLRVNPADYERETASLKASGFEKLGVENAYWWKK